MIEVELQIPEDIKASALIGIVERVCIANGLFCSLKGTLVNYPGSIHWHFGKDKQKGTLEITWWETKKRLWFKVAKNRTSAWIEESISRLKDQIEKSLVKL